MLAPTTATSYSSIGPLLCRVRKAPYIEISATHGRRFETQSDRRSGANPKSGRDRQLVAPAHRVERRALGRRPARDVRGGDQLLGVELRPVVATGEAADRLLHQRPPQVVDSPAQRLAR